MDKRGLSAVVTTLIIILLVLVSTGIIWVVIRNLVTEGAEGIDLSKFTFDLTIKRAYVDGADVLVSVRRSPGGGEMVGINFIFLNETDSIVIQKNISLDELDEKSFVFNSTDVPGIGAGDDVSVAPIYLSNSGRETMGDITDTEEIGGSPPASEGAGDCDPVCTGTDTCINDVCVPEACVPEDPVVTCGSWVCGEQTNNCGEIISCPPGCTAPRTECNQDTGQCDAITVVEVGTVYSTWPQGVNIYFDSDNLSQVESYIDYYVSFPGGSESECLLVLEHTWPREPLIYNKSIIRLGAISTDVATNDNYEVWPTFESCLG